MTLLTEHTTDAGFLQQTGRCACGNTHERSWPPVFIDRLRDSPFVCDDCRDRERAEDDARRQRELADEALRERVRRARIPASYETAGPAGCPQNALEAAEAWGRLEIGGLCLIGPPGVGKTHLAAYATRLRAENGHGVLWFSAPKLFAALRGAFGDDRREMALRQITGDDAAYRGVRPPFDLVIDDLDKTRPTDFAAEMLYVAVDDCVTNGRGLAITSNMSLKEISNGSWIDQRFGHPIADRIRGYCAVRGIGGTSKREPRA